MRMVIGQRSLVIGFLLAVAFPAFADGGAVLREEISGPYRLTIFGAPVPLRAGPADLSVLVQDAQSGTPVLNQHVEISVTAPAAAPAEGTEAWVPPCCSMKVKAAAVTATHAAAQNKLLYAANVVIPASGPHDITVTVRAPDGDPEKPALATGVATAQVAPPAPPLTAYWAYLLAPPFLIAGFALHQRLRHRRR